MKESENPETGKSGNDRVPFLGNPTPISLLMLCLLILLLAWSLRLYQLNADSLWEDEIFTATQAPLPVDELLRWTAGDIHPPGYYLIVGRLAAWLGWAHLPPTVLTDWLWRFPSTLVGLVAVALAYRLGADLLSKQVGLVVALLLAVSPVAIQYSQEARMHQLFLLGATLSTWTLARALARPGQWEWWLAYALATAFSLYTVYLAFVVLAAQAGWVIISQISLAFRPPDRPALTASPEISQTNLKSQKSNVKLQISGWFASVALALVLYLPWWPILLSIVSRRLAVGDMEVGVGSPLPFLVKGVYALGPGPGWAAWLFLGLWVIGLGSIVGQRPALAFFGGLWLVLPLALPFVFRDPRALQVRYVFLLPIYLLFVALGVMALAAGGWRLAAGREHKSGSRGVFGSGRPRTEIIDRRNYDSLISRFLFVVVLMGLVLASVFHLPNYYQRTKTDWRSVGAYLEGRTNPGDIIVIGPLFDVGRYLDYYYDGPAELMPPAFLVANLPERMASMRTSGGRVWAVTRFQPTPVAAVRNVEFPGLTVSEPVVAVYEPDLLAAAMIDLMQQAVTAAPDWAAEMSGGGVMDPDPMVARAAAYLFLGDVHREAGHLSEAVAAYEAMVADYPASAGGYVTLAEAYEATNQPEAAVRAYQQAIALNPSWSGLPVDEAASLAEAGHWGEAAAAYRAIVR